MIGDNYQTDILGAKGAGLDVMWFNIHHEANTSLEQINYEISSLQEIMRIL
jgi:FMN phosphatase YigB (HAD superfamily)